MAKSGYRAKLAAMTDAELLAEAAMRISLYLESEKSLTRITAAEWHDLETRWISHERGLKDDYERLRAELVQAREKENAAQLAYIANLGVPKCDTAPCSQE